MILDARSLILVLLDRSFYNAFHRISLGEDIRPTEALGRIRPWLTCEDLRGFVGARCFGRQRSCLSKIEFGPFSSFERPLFFIPPLVDTLHEKRNRWLIHQPCVVTFQPVIVPPQAYILNLVKRTVHATIVVRWHNEEFFIFSCRPYAFIGLKSSW